MPKNIVICYDGTGNEYGPHNTNVVGTFQAMIRDPAQIGFYDPGVGTFSFLGRVFGKRIGVMLGKAFGYGLRRNIEDGYRYLMEYYDEGDRLFLFGFSRGAFAARSLAGMLHDVGLLERGSMNLVPYATRIYLGDEDETVAEGFKSTYCHECKPLFVGVWDTVASLGLFLGKRFPDTNLNDDVAFGYQAISIDEQRKKFPISLWDEDDAPRKQTIVQVWFRGVHSDIGGGYPERGLSDIALIWLLEHAQQHGLRLKDGWKSGFSPDPLGEVHNSRIGIWRIWRPAPREIPPGAKIHESVRVRMQALPDETWPPLPADHVFVGNAGRGRKALARPSTPGRKISSAIASQRVEPVP